MQGGGVTACVSGTCANSSAASGCCSEYPYASWDACNQVSWKGSCPDHQYTYALCLYDCQGFTDQRCLKTDLPNVVCPAPHTGCSKPYVPIKMPNEDACEKYDCAHGGAK